MYFPKKMKLTNAILCSWTVVCIFCSPSLAQLTVYTDRTAFQQALGASSISDNFMGYSLGQIGQGSKLGDFLYGFTPASTLPMIAPDGSGNHVLGGAPYSVLVGGDQVILTGSTNLGALTAFGLDLSYAPASSTIPANTYSVTILDGPAAGSSVGNPPLSSGGGTCFLGFVANPGVTFTSVRVSSTQSDASVIVPACQVNDLIYGSGTTSVSVTYFSGVQRTGSTVLLKGGGGQAGGRFFFLSATNLALPLNQWVPVATNYFDSSGNFSATQLMSRPMQFFLIKPN